MLVPALDVYEEQGEEPESVGERHGRRAGGGKGAAEETVQVGPGDLKKQSSTSGIWCKQSKLLFFELQDRQGIKLMDCMQSSTFCLTFIKLLHTKCR